MKCLRGEMEMSPQHRQGLGNRRAPMPCISQIYLYRQAAYHCSGHKARLKNPKIRQRRPSLELFLFFSKMSIRRSRPHLHDNSVVGGPVVTFSAQNRRLPRDPDVSMM